MPNRERLPNRRRLQPYKIHMDDGTTWHASVGYYDDGRPGEVFMSTAKVGSHVEAIASDMAIAVSFALQYGANPEDIRQSLKRDNDGSPATALGELLDTLHAENT